MTNDYRKLEVWVLAMDLAKSIYKFTQLIPKEEQFGLVSQMRRSAVSIPSNIAEGRMRGSEAEFKRFLLIAFGSGAELETQLRLATEIYRLEGKADEPERLLSSVMRMLNKLIGVIKG